MPNRIAILSMPALIGAVLCLCSTVSGQAAKPLTNDDVLSMVKKKMPESVIVAAIKSRPGEYDTSTNELIRLNSAGVSEAELNAMIAAAQKGADAQLTSGTSNADAKQVSEPRMPKVWLVRGGTSQELALEKTQLAQTKNKPTSMKSLAGDSAMAQAFQAGIGTATWDAATHMNSAFAGSAVQEAGSVLSGILAHRTPTVTYVWGVPSPASGNVLQTISPEFNLDFSRTPGVQPDDYEPEIVKLTPAQNTCRIVGATQGKADLSASPAADWQVYSHYLEEKASAHAEKLGPGKYKLAASNLAAGEYGIVLRPVSTTKKFSGGDVARAQGDGLMFDAIWTFQVPEEAQ